MFDIVSTFNNLASLLVCVLLVAIFIVLFCFIAGFVTIVVKNTIHLVRNINKEKENIDEKTCQTNDAL